MAQCVEIKKDGEQCKKPAMVGKIRCKSHGATAGRKPIHGRYCRIQRPRIAELLVEFGNDPDPLNLLPEVHLLRSLIMDYVERYDEVTEAVCAWHESYSDEYQWALKAWHKKNDELPESERSNVPDPIGYGKPKQVLDIISAGKFIADIGNITDKIIKREETRSVTMETLVATVRAYAQAVGAAIAETIPDEHLTSKLSAAIDRRTGNITVAGAPSKSG